MSCTKHQGRCFQKQSRFYFIHTYSTKPHIHLHIFYVYLKMGSIVWISTLEMCLSTDIYTFLMWRCEAAKMHRNQEIDLTMSPNNSQSIFIHNHLPHATSFEDLQWKGSLWYILESRSSDMRQSGKFFLVYCHVEVVNMIYRSTNDSHSGKNNTR